MNISFYNKKGKRTRKNTNFCLQEVSFKIEPWTLNHGIISGEVVLCSFVSNNQQPANNLRTSNTWDMGLKGILLLETLG